MSTTSTTFKWHWYVSVAVAIFLFVIVGLYSLSMARNTTGYDEEQGRIRAQKLAAMQELDRKTLTTPDWIDKNKGIVRIPVEEAMALEVGALKTKPLTMGTVIPGATVAVTAPVSTAPSSSAIPAGTVSNAASASGTSPSTTGKPPETNSGPAPEPKAPTGSAVPASKPTK